jgi:predicted  nucleic acid-binding Zn-ribbon protein
MSKRRGYTAEELELARLIWDECREGSVIRDSTGRPSYILALNLARVFLSKAYEAGFDDPLSEIDWRAIIDCGLEYSEMIAEYERWLRDNVGRTKSIDQIVYSEIDMLRLDIESLKNAIKSLESLSSGELAEMGLTEEDRQRQLDELRSNLAKLEAELKRLEEKRMRRMRARVVVRAPERERTRKLIEYAVGKPETRLGRYIRQTVLGEFIARKPVPAPTAPVSEEDVFREAQRIYSEFMSYHSGLVDKFKPVSERINTLIKKLHDLEKQFKEASEAGDLERLKQLLPEAEKVEKELAESFREAGKLRSETRAERAEWRSRKVDVVRRLFELKRRAPGKSSEIGKMASEISELSPPDVKWEVPPEWVYSDQASIMSRAMSLVKRARSRIAELEYRGRAVPVSRKLKEVMGFEDFLNKLRERLDYYGVPAEAVSMFIGEVEADLRRDYEEADYAELEEVLARLVMYFKTEYIPAHFIILPARLLAGRGVRVDHPREILIYGMWVKPRISYLKPRFDSWVRDCTVSGYTVKNKPITIKPGKTHFVIDPGVAVESAIVAVADETIYLVNAPAIGYVYDPDSRYVEYYYYSPCPLLSREH